MKNMLSHSREKKDPVLSPWQVPEYCLSTISGAYCCMIWTPAGPVSTPWHGCPWILINLSFFYHLQCLMHMPQGHGTAYFISGIAYTNLSFFYSLVCIKRYYWDRKIIIRELPNFVVAQGSGVLCDRRVPQKLKDKFYMTAIRPAMLYGDECWPTKKQHV